VTPETRLIAIGAPSDLHVTRQLFAAFQAGREGVPRLSVTTPLAETVDALNGYQPEALLAYASVVGALADEQLDGRLAIEPDLIVTTSEVLTDETERRIEAAWGRRPVNAYAATEAPGIAIGSRDAVGMHVFEDSLVLEVVDDDRNPGVAGRAR
jgi:phenylacetate-CoA ligase